MKELSSMIENCMDALGHIMLNHEEMTKQNIVDLVGDIQARLQLAYEITVSPDDNHA